MSSVVENDIKFTVITKGLQKKMVEFSKKLIIKMIRSFRAMSFFTTG
jgi:hypothetical protein